MPWKGKPAEGMNITKSLIEFADDEGKHAAISKCERWRDVLEEMVEVASKSQRQRIRVLVDAVYKAANTIING